MQRNFFQLKQFLEHNYPQLQGRVSGGNYPPPQFAVYLAQIIGYIQIFAIAAVFLGDNIWDFIPFVNSPPSWYYDMKNNGMAVFIFLFALSSIAGTLTQTGAFEIELDGEVVFSKIEMGRFPSFEELQYIFNTKMS